MPLNNHLHTYSQNHSVKEAVVSFFVKPQIESPKDYENLLDIEGVVKDNYSKYEPIKEVSLKFILEKGNEPQLQQTQDTGFKLTGFCNGETSKVIQGICQPLQSVFTFNDIAYVRWNVFINHVMNAAKEVANLKKIYTLSAFSLLYIDEFYYDASSPYNPLELFNVESLDLPKGIETSSIVDYNLTLNKAFKLGQYIDNRSIKVIDINEKKTIRIINNLTFPLKESESWHEFLDRDEFLYSLNFGHQENKTLLCSILNKEISKSIGLCVC